MPLSGLNPLTSLPDRIYFNEVLNRSLTQAARHQKILALLLIEIDHFSKIENTYGSSFSQQILEELSNRFSTALRAGDILSHLENETFALLLTDLKQPFLASAVAEKLLKISSQPFSIDAQTLSLTISIAVCIFPEDG